LQATNRPTDHFDNVYRRPASPPADMTVVC